MPISNTVKSGNVVQFPHRCAAIRDLWPEIRPILGGDSGWWGTHPAAWYGAIGPRLCGFEGCKPLEEGFARGERALEIAI